MEPLLSQIDGEIDQFTADGAYDGIANLSVRPAAQWNREHRHSTALDCGGKRFGRAGQRDKHIAKIAKDGRLKWQAATGYGKRALIETAIGRYKASIGRRLRARSFPAQQTEIAIGCAVLNRILANGRPESVRHHDKQA